MYLDQRGRSKPYEAKDKRGGKHVYLGTFATAEEAALCVARSPEGREAAESAPPPQMRPADLKHLLARLISRLCPSAYVKNKAHMTGQTASGGDFPCNFPATGQTATAHGAFT